MNYEVCHGAGAVVVPLMTAAALTDEKWRTFCLSRKRVPNAPSCRATARRCSLKPHLE